MRNRRNQAQRRKAAAQTHHNRDRERARTVRAVRSLCAKKREALARFAASRARCAAADGSRVCAHARISRHWLSLVSARRSYASFFFFVCSSRSRARRIFVAAAYAIEMAPRWRARARRCTIWNGGDTIAANSK